MAKVYMFDPETREFMGEEDAFVEPVKGKDVEAVNATLFPPIPDIPAGYSQVFRRGVWTVVEDHRGQRALDIANRRFYTVSQLGNIPTGHVTVHKDMEKDYLEHPHHYGFSESSFFRLEEDAIAAIDLEDDKQKKLDERYALFDFADWRMQRALDTGDSEEQQRIRDYRSFLRDFTKRDTWWELPIPSLDEFIKETKEKS
ncbi:MAG: hypothetical protein LBS22_01520 [Puniceicoccales bacterium]|jgi:hypothetical protein|nr:hypothetical protein [Puniceicoccales bacterium]